MAPSKKTSASRPVLLLLDGHSLAYRAYYALKEANLQTTTGQPTGAVQGFTSMLINTLRDEAPTHVAVCFDVSRQTFRTEKFPEYKANRSASPDDFKSQIGLIDELLAALAITVLRKEGVEADDVIATLTTQAAAEGYEVRILTGDRDSLQLVTEDVTVLYPKRGVSDLARFTPAAVEEKYELTPAQYPDFAALRGDPSDNLPNIPGVGEKTAAKWVREFGSLDQLLERAGEVKGKAGETLRAHLDQVRMNRELTELVRDVPMGIGPEDLAWASAGDADAVYQLFDTLEFAKSMRDRVAPLLSTFAAAAVAEAAEVTVEGRILGEGELAPWLAENTSGGAATGVAMNGRSARGTGDVEGLAFAAADGTAAYADLTRLDPAEEKALATWLADASQPKVLHDAKGTILALAARGLPLAGVVADTALEAYLLLPAQRSFELEPLAEQFLGRRFSTAGAEDQGTLFEDDAAVPAGKMAEAHAVLDLADALREQLVEAGAEPLLTDIELPLVGVLADMERTGIAVDLPYLKTLEEAFAKDVANAVEQAHEAAGQPFNLGSPKQLQEILFDKMNLPKTKKIKTGYTTDADALTLLATKTENALPGILLRHREVNRLKTVVEGLQKALSDDGRIHTTYNQMIAATGRLSSENPNLQNIPIRTLEGQQIRAAFVAGSGFESLMTADYSQIEMRIMAHLSEDEGLIEAFTSGEDLHNTVAAKVFSVEPSKVDAEMRRRIKAMSYGLAYGLSAFGLSQQLNIETSEASKMMEDYFARFGGIRDYLREVVERARVTGYTETIHGRRRYLPDLLSDNRHRREMAERMALNAPIQGSAADIIKIAMIRVRDALVAEKLSSRILLQVHDELVLEVAKGEAEKVEELVRREMASAAELRVPLDVSVGNAKNWAEAAH